MNAKPTGDKVCTIAHTYARTCLRLTDVSERNMKRTIYVY